MTKEQLMRFIDKEADICDSRLSEAGNYEQWQYNRAALTQFIDSMDKLFEIYNMENRE